MRSPTCSVSVSGTLGQRVGPVLRPLWECWMDLYPSHDLKPAAGNTTAINKRTASSSRQPRGGRRSMRHSTRCFTASKPIAPRAMASRNRGSDLIGAEYLDQPQNLYELALTLLTHPSFQ